MSKMPEIVQKYSYSGKIYKRDPVSQLASEITECRACFAAKNIDDNYPLQLYA